MKNHSEFKLPTIFLEMQAMGWLDKLKKNSYLWLYEMRWLTQDEVENYEYEEFESKEVIPFAYNAYGDKWGWYSNDRFKNMVVFCPHDDDEGIIYAKDLQSAMFRQILEFLSQNNFCISHGEKWEITLEEARKHLKDWEKRFHIWFKNEWLEEIQGFIKDDLKFYNAEVGYYVIITPEECEELINKYLMFEQLNQTFKWTIE